MPKTQGSSTAKMLTSPLFQGLVDGWVSASESWVFASATTITVPTDATTKYRVGDKIKLTQTTVKYFFIVGVTSTVLTITGGTDYTLANAAISANYYSHDESPLGFPGWFAYAPTITSGTGAFTTVAAIAKFTLISRICHLKIEVTTTTVGTAAQSTIFTLPITAVEAERDIGSGLERFNTGDALVVRASTTLLGQIRNYVNGFAGGNGSIQICSLAYQV